MEYEYLSRPIEGYDRHNCHGVAADTFMARSDRHRWREVWDFYPQEYPEPEMEVMRVEGSSREGVRDWSGLTREQQMEVEKANAEFFQKQCAERALKRYKKARKIRAKSPRAQMMAQLKAIRELAAAIRKAGDEPL